MSRMLYLIRGLPGSGKSTFAQELAGAIGAFHYEADMFHVRDGVYDWKPENVHAAHQWCQNAARHAMSLYTPVVVSNTFTTAKEMEPYLDLAQRFGYRITSLVVEHRHDGVNQHNVPQETLDKMRNRFTIKL